MDLIKYLEFQTGDSCLSVSLIRHKLTLDKEFICNLYLLRRLFIQTKLMIDLMRSAALCCHLVCHSSSAQI